MDIIEDIAKTIFLHEGGLAPGEYEAVTGKRQKLWKTDAQWDSQPDIELCEWERDEYRVMASAVVDLLVERGMVGKA